MTQSSFFSQVTTLKKTGTHPVEPELVPVVLPWELLIEILSWLPVKALMQFRCVSKSWKSLISDNKAFMKMHMKRSYRNEHILITLQVIPYSEYDDICVIPHPVRRLLKEPLSSVVDDEDGHCRWKSAKYTAIGSYNGLVCLVGFDEDASEELWVRFWNPTTRLKSGKSPICGFHWRSRMYFGFAYDDSRHAYKVVVVFWYPIEQAMETMAYCMGDSCWRKVLSDLPLVLKPLVGQFVGGCLNWLGLDKLNCHYNHWEDTNATLQQLVIVSFDMREETYKFLPLPEGISHDVPHVDSHLGVLRNCLCIFHDHKRTHFVVWQMREYGIRESWTKLVSVSYEHIQLDGFPLYTLPLMFLCEDDDILWLVKDKGLEVAMYNIRDSTMKCIQLPANKCWLSGYTYVESLVSPY